MIEEVGISVQLSEIQIVEVLSKVFTGLEFTKLDIDSIEKIQINPHYVMFDVVEIDCDFPIRVELYFADQEFTNQREQYLALKISNYLKCRTIVPYVNPDKEDDPYYDLVFDSGKIFLASDCESKFDGGGDKDILIVKELELQIDSNFDVYGNYIKTAEVEESNEIQL